MDLIPIPKDVPDMTLVQTLDGIEYTLHITWNMRAGWFFGLYDANDVVILAPVRMTVGSDLLAGIRYNPLCPTGELLVVDFSNQDLEPGYLDLVSGASEADLQGRVGLVYVPLNDPDLQVV